MPMHRRTPMLALLALLVAPACGSDGDGDIAGGGKGGVTSGGGTSSGGAGGTGGIGGSSGGTGATGGSGGIAGTGASAGSGGSGGAPACVISEITTIKDTPSYAIARFAYPSIGGIKVYGETCQPKSAGPHPVLIWNHGGFAGLQAPDRTLCESFTANAGYAVVMSEYRGEGGSQGQIEVCLGEADDVIALMDCFPQAPQLDMKRLIMAGGSHGGCITLRAVQKGAPVVAAVDIFGPSDLAAEHAYWKAELATGPDPQLASLYNMLINVVETATGGPPSAVPDEYKKRSPATFASDLTNYPGDFLIVQGSADLLVPASQSCLIAGLAGGFAARHYASDATTLLTTPPAGCESSNLTWLATPKPSPGWAGARHLEIYEGVGHSFATDTPAEKAMFDDFAKFVLAKTPP